MTAEILPIPLMPSDDLVTFLLVALISQCVCLDSIGCWGGGRGKPMPGYWNYLLRFSVGENEFLSHSLYIKAFSDQRLALSLSHQPIRANTFVKNSLILRLCQHVHAWTVMYVSGVVVEVVWWHLSKADIFWFHDMHACLNIPLVLVMIASPFKLLSQSHLLIDIKETTPH